MWLISERGPRALGWPGRYHQDGLAFEHRLAVDRAYTVEARAPFCGKQFGNPHLGDDFVADLHRAAEVERLRHIDRTGPRQLHAEHGGEVAGGEHAVRDSSLEYGLGGISLVQMDWVLVARHLGKCADIGFRDSLREACLHAELEVLEVVGIAR